MKIAIGSDKRTGTTDRVIEFLKSQGHQILLFGNLIDAKDGNWVKIAKKVALEVKKKRVHEAILFCWTGTGVAMVASKIPGVRAVTVSDPKIAKKAKAWDHANILALSCFLSPKKAVKIVEVWLNTRFSTDPDDIAAQAEIAKIETEFSG